VTIQLSQSSQPGVFFARNWLFVPLGTDPYRGVMSVSGIAGIRFAGVAGHSDWRRDRVVMDLTPDLERASMQAPWSPAPQPSWTWTRQAWLAFVTVESRDASAAQGVGGTAVDSWGLTDTGLLYADIAALGTEGINRIGYRLDLSVELQPYTPQ
jgi:hypothetical protein